jgi:hypothetical protein
MPEISGFRRVAGAILSTFPPVSPPRAAVMLGQPRAGPSTFTILG